MGGFSEVVLRGWACSWLGFWKEDGVKNNCSVRSYVIVRVKSAADVMVHP